MSEINAHNFKGIVGDNSTNTYNDNSVTNNIEKIELNKF